jgi:hypothetical protein
VALKAIFSNKGMLDKYSRKERMQEGPGVRKQEVSGKATFVE